MQPCDAEGRYAGHLTKMAIGSTSGGCLQLIADCELHVEHNDETGEWVALQGGSQEITAYVILTKRDGSINGYQYGVLKGALDWDGKDIEHLQTQDFSGRKVAVHVIENDYRNDGSLKVDFISALDWTPGISAATGKDLDKIKAKWAASKASDDDGKSEPADGELPPDSDIPF
jgi:hypothetical protein